MMNPNSPPRSLWQLKPWWCQPWSIVLTGVTVPVGVWWFSHRLWLTLPVVVLILLWWYVFLYLVPQEYAQVQMNHPQGISNLPPESEKVDPQRQKE